MQATDAAGVLYARHSARILGFCLSRLGSREEAEDALQTTFVHALRALRRGVVPRNEEAWLNTIAQNVCLSDRRSARSRVHREQSHDPQVLADSAAATEHEADELFGLGEALAGIPKRQRQALLLREWQGLSYREIGASLGLGQAAVETLLFRARRSLAEALDGEKPLRRRVQRVLDVVLGAGGLKSLLGGGSGAKVAAAVAASMAAVVTVAGDGSRPSIPAKPRPTEAAASAANAANSRGELPHALPARQRKSAPLGMVPAPRQRYSSSPASATSGAPNEAGGGPTTQATVPPAVQEPTVAPATPAAKPRPTQGSEPAQPTDTQRPELLPSIGSTLADPGEVIADPGSLLPDLPQAPVDLDSLVPDPPPAPDVGSIAPEIESALPDVSTLPGAPPVAPRAVPDLLPDVSGPGLPALP
jgi:RNA polymerase sigma factor (sigma-70 family)